MTITEPATLVTDYVLAALATFFAVRLSGWWSRAFALTAASAFLGGTYHGLWATDALWRATLATAALASWATMRAAASQWLPPPRERRAAVAAFLKLVVALVAGALRPTFLVVLVDFALTLVFLGGAAASGRHRDPRAFAAVLAGLALFVAGAAVQQAGVSPSPHFNHNDLFHVVQIAANACFFLAARRAERRV